MHLKTEIRKVPLFYQHNINETTRLGIWHINEDEDFFLAKVPLQQTITHPHKRLQHLAGRYLLQYLFPDFPYEEIIIADTRKPYLPNEQYHFSISHCGDYAAAIVSPVYRVGIDIEIPTEKVERIAHKFISENERSFLAESVICNEQSIPDRLLFTILWSAKEAVFKWYSLGKVDFKENIQLNNIIQKQNNAYTLPFIFTKEDINWLNIHCKLFDEIVLSWVL